MKRTAIPILAVVLLLFALSGCGREKQGNMQFALNPDGQGYALVAYKNTASQTVGSCREVEATRCFRWGGIKT